MTVQAAGHNRGYRPHPGFQPNRGHQPRPHCPQPNYRPQPRPYFPQPNYRPQPMPYFPPQQYRPMPMPYNPYQPNPYQPNPYSRGIGGAIGDFGTGISERLQQVFQVVLHPFNAYARRPVYHNPYVPYTTAFKMGQWAVNGALLVGAFLGVSAVAGGGMGSLGGMIGMG